MDDKEKKRLEQLRKKQLGQNGDSQGGAHKPKPGDDFDEDNKPRKKRKKKK
jgi:hypothetical protein